MQAQRHIPDEESEKVLSMDVHEGRQAQSGVAEHASSPAEEKLSKNTGNQIGGRPETISDQARKSRLGKDGGGRVRGSSELESMKERYSKLLLGEDMSGGGKGVSSALALSNAITNLAASVFGEQYRLEPMSAERKARWRKEMDWLLSVTDHIVEVVPSEQATKDGTNVEVVMETHQRTDLLVNIPALRKLDAMLIESLDNFRDQNEFSYVSRNQDDPDECAAQQRQEDKWWLPKLKVPAEGLSEATRKCIQTQKDSVNQVLKAAMAINTQVLSEIQIPEAYIESLPKNGRESLGDAMYKSITDYYFDPEQFLASMDLSTEYKIVDVKDRIEASMVIWQRKMHHKDGKSSWGSSVSLEKRGQFEERTETILFLLKHRFPGCSQSSLDISKIQYNRDVGQSVIESYSRVLESLASTVLNRIEDVLYADSQTRNPLTKQGNGLISSPTGPAKMNVIEEIAKLNTPVHSPNAKKLSEIMDWPEEVEKNGTEEFTKKPTSIITNTRFSFIETLGGLRSPSSRH